MKMKIKLYVLALTLLGAAGAIQAGEDRSKAPQGVSSQAGAGSRLYTLDILMRDSKCPGCSACKPQDFPQSPQDVFIEIEDVAAFLRILGGDSSSERNPASSGSFSPQTAQSSVSHKGPRPFRRGRFPQPRRSLQKSSRQ